jgi:hypothetical protein
MKLNSKIHGIIDYTVVIFLWSSPTLFAFPKIASGFTYILGCIHLALTLATNFELGVVKIIPLKIHGWIELVVSITLFCCSFLLGNLEGIAPEIFYMVFAVAVFLTWSLTDYGSYQKNRSSLV